LAKEAEPGLTGDDQGRWLETLASDQGNFRAALTWALAHDPNLALSLAGALWRFWYRAGRADGRPGFSRARAGERASDSSARAKALAGAAGLMVIQTELAQASELAGESARIYEQLGDQEGMSTALNLMGSIAYHRGRYDEATAFIEQSLDAKRELGDDWGVSVGLLTSACS